MGRYSSHLYAWRFSKPNLTIGVGNARLDYCLTLMYPGFFFFFRALCNSSENSDC